MRKQLQFMEVSVVIPVKNGLPFIEECLQSLYNQTFQGTWEICVYSDGSTDNTVACAKKWIPSFALRGVEMRIKEDSESRGL
ncbi:unnamed protein product [Nippostrongylus brasiliensis]|uniref:Glyco_trans_2-like domain-containing protein n=1 Tax=Nippostrongylus brasiliensis TaxID=27835 RepID=A0A0N4XQA2_NIPBR|nr:unnamed protein product [Nippostrongylus brasiliensis]